MAITGKNDSGNEIISDINVTPFVDVSLVLLIIFMVTATYIIAQSIPVDLPEAATGENVVTTLAITMTENGDVYLDGVKTDKATLSRTVSQAHSKNAELRVVIAADKRVTHGAVVSVIDLVRNLGVSKFAINIDSNSKDD
jgi:biopolymer transport protein ExbD